MYSILSLTESDEWNKLLEELPLEYQDIYYSPSYYQIYQNYGDGEALCFVYREDDKIALYPFFKNSVNNIGYTLDDEYFDIQGAYGYNGVISNTNSSLFRSNFHKGFRSYCESENIIAEFTRFHPLLENFKFSMDDLNVIYDRSTIFLNLDASEEEIWNNSYSSKNRNMIRKALKNNVEIIESTKSSDYLDFFNIYVETMRNVNSGDYLFFNQLYFADFVAYLPDNHRLILAKIGNEIIGGMILMFSKNYAHYHLSSRKLEYGKYALNNLFLDYAIKVAKGLKAKKIHFGGGNSSDEKDSLLKFKANFSKNKSDFFIGKKIHNQEIYNQVITQWEEKYPEKKEPLNKVLLKYRM